MSLKDKYIAPSVLSGGPNFAAPDRAILTEVVQRCRRMETRLTRLLETEGIQTGIYRPWWSEDSRVMIPTPMTTIDAILKVIPERWPQTVQVVWKEDQELTVMCRILAS